VNKAEENTDSQKQLEEIAVDLGVLVEALDQELKTNPTKINLSRHQTPDKYFVIQTINSLFKLVPPPENKCAHCEKIPDAYEVWKKKNGKLQITDEGDADTIHESRKHLEHAITYDANEILEKCPQCSRLFGYRRVKDEDSISLFLLRENRINALEMFRDYYVNHKRGRLDEEYDSNQKFNGEHIPLTPEIKTNLRNNFIANHKKLWWVPVIILISLGTSFNHLSLQWLIVPFGLILVFGKELLSDYRLYKRELEAQEVISYKGKITNKEISNNYYRAGSYIELDHDHIFMSGFFNYFSPGDFIEIIIGIKSQKILDVKLIQESEKKKPKTSRSTPISVFAPPTIEKASLTSKDRKKIRKDLRETFFESAGTYFSLVFFIPLMIEILAGHYNYIVPFTGISIIMTIYVFAKSRKHVKDLLKGEKSVSRNLIQDKFTTDTSFHHNRRRVFGPTNVFVFYVNDVRVETSEQLFKGLNVGDPVILEMAPYSKTFLDFYPEFVEGKAEEVHFE
jgi:hypothetical protein